jgi:hypothetical protein
MHYIVGSIAGFIVGIFTPGVTRKLKSLFSAEVKKADGYVSAEVGKVEADVKKKL